MNINHPSKCRGVKSNLSRSGKWNKGIYTTWSNRTTLWTTPDPPMKKQVRRPISFSDSNSTSWSKFNTELAKINSASTKVLKNWIGRYRHKIQVLIFILLSYTPTSLTLYCPSCKTTSILATVHARTKVHKIACWTRQLTQCIGNTWSRGRGLLRAVRGSITEFGS